MPPNTPPVQPNQNVNPGVVPPAPQTPATPGMPVQASPAPVPSPKKSKKGLIIILSVVIGLLVLGAIAVFGIFAFLLSGDSSKSSSTSYDFMQAMTTGNVDAALKYTDGSTGSKSFLEGMAPGVKATSFSKKESTNKSGKYYYLYTLQGATNNTSRTELEKDKDSGKWYITGFYAGDNLALIGASATDESTDTASSGQCLVQSDFDEWYKGVEGMGKTASEYGFHYEDPDRPYSANIHFNADSLNTSDDNTGAVEKIAKLANDPSVKGKQFTVRLYGGVATSQADKDFANQRAEKVKSELVAAGVPAEKIVIDPASSATDYDSDPNAIDKQMSRVVVIKFVSTCPSSGQ